MNFSVITRNSTAYKSGRKEYEDYKKSILDPERIKIRENIFFNYTVPSFIKNSSILLEKNISLKLKVALSALLPEYLLNKFKDLKNKNPEIFDFIIVDEDHFHDWQKIFDSEVEEISEKYYFNKPYIPVFNFRLDDDDILLDNYYLQIDKYLEECYEGVYLSFSKGFIGIYDDGYKIFYKVNRPYLAIGLGKISIYSVRNKCIITKEPVVINKPHTKIVENSISLVDSRGPSYIWTMHYYSDTRSVDQSRKQSDSRIRKFIEDNNLQQVSIEEVGLDNK